MQKVLLCVLDGFGLSNNNADNAIAAASTPFFDHVFKNFPNSKIYTSGLDVGLPDGQMGNSEVGHMNIGSGRIILQDLPKINDAILTRSIDNNEAIQNIINVFADTNKNFHLIGLLSDGGVHSHQDHLIYLARYLAQNRVNIKIHAFLDGRDTLPQSAKNYVNNLLDNIGQYKNIEFVTITGRYYAMDRDKRWDRIERAYNAIVCGLGEKMDNAILAIEDSYKNGIYDEFILPHTLDNYTGMQDDDGFLIINFRADRVRQIAHSLVDVDFNGFPRNKTIRFKWQGGMMDYSDVLAKSMISVFPNEEIKNSLPQILSDHGLKQLRIAETEKYAHVTFFFNGGAEMVLPGEDRILIQSPKVSTYDEIPEMSAYDLTERTIEAIESNKYDFIVVNYANCDMVGHTGNFKAAVEAVETIDKCVSELTNAATKHGFVSVITADHGNVEQMRNGDQPHTAHTLNPVPLIILTNAEKKGNFSLKDGRLCDIAPTILEIMELPQPKEMTGHSLIDRSFK